MSDTSAGDGRAFRFIALACVLALVVTAGAYLLTRPGGRTITAYFSSGTALFEQNEVRVLGVRVGTIESVTPEGDQVRVVMELDRGIEVPANASAAIVSPSLVTGRHVYLSPPYTAGEQMQDGAVIPRERTAVPLGVDDLTRTTTELATMLGPNGVNRDGALSDLLDVGAQNLDGNGQAFNDTVGDLSRLSTTLSDSRQDLFGTVTELQSFVSTIAANDAQVRQLNVQLTDVAGFLAAERTDLGAALAQLSVALGDVSAFVRDNRAVVASNVDRLTEVTNVLVAQRDAIAEIADLAPTALNNLTQAYNAQSGTLDTRANLQELTLPPILLACRLIRSGTPTGLPPTLSDLCDQLAPVLDGLLPLPSLMDIIVALESGQPPPVPGLAVPIVGEDG